MNRQRIFPALFCALSLMLVVFSSAGQSTNLYNYAPVSGISNTPAFSVISGIVTRPAFLFQSGPITNASSGSFTTNGVTNAISFNIQFSVDANNSNWITLTNFNPFMTNGEVDAFAPNFNQITVPLFMRLQIVTTNQLSAGAYRTQ
jgi:hypothetical protein